MQALILVGGKGTRLRPLTSRIPKPIVPLVDRPFISHMIEWLGSHGVEEVVLACGFLPDALRRELGDGGPGGPGLKYVTEPDPLGTAGAIKFAEELLEDRFLALNGDVLTDLDLTALIASHLERSASASLALYPVDDPSGYGLVELAADHSVERFLEKPGPDHRGSGMINAGAYVLERSVLERVPEGRAVSIEREVFPDLIGEGLYGMPLSGYWMDIGTPERYLQAGWDLLEGRVNTRVDYHGDGVMIAPGAEVSESAKVGPRAIVGDGCRVASGAAVTGSVLLEGCEVGRDAVVEGSILAPGAAVAEGATVTGAVIGQNELVDA